MGRGSSGAKQTTYSASTVMTAGGVQINLGSTPLVYGAADPALTGAVRTAITAFEDKRWKNRTEYSRFVAADGSVIEDNHGGKTSVGASFAARMTAAAMSHNHPRDNGSGQLGGTFSTDDIGNFSHYAQTTYRATAAEGTYSISKGPGFDKKGLRSYYKAENAKNRAAYTTAHSAAMRGYNQAVRDYQAGKVDYKAVQAAYKAGVQASTDAFNQFLIANHNALLAGQKKYGYTYTLERRP